MVKRVRRSDVIVAEQAAVDHAYQCLGRTRREAAELKSVAASASGKDAIDAARTWQRELDSLDLGRNSLVFMRADVDEGTGPETFYIGRRSVFDAHHNPAVISWSAPAAVQWRLTSEQDPGQVRLLRQIVCDERIVNRYFDLHGTELRGASADDEQEPREHAQAAGVNEQSADASGKGLSADEPEWHDPLLDELDRARDGAMHDIVETIQRDQLRLVTEQPSGVLIVQGGPGTGKTAVGMHRVSWLLDNGHMAARDVLVVGPNRVFLEYVSAALGELGARDVTMLELPALWSAGAAPVDPPEVAALKSDARMSAVLHRAVDDHTTSTAERLEALVGGPVFTFELHRREVVVPVAEIAGIAGDALSGDSPYRVRRERCVQRIVQRLTEAYTGVLPGPADVDYFADVRGLRPVTRLLRRISPELSARDVLRRLLASGAAMASAADGILTAEEQALLTAHREDVTMSGKTVAPSREDLVCIEELEFALSGRPEQTYGHVVVDEAQDLTPMQARSLARRCPSGSMTILGDLAQATGPGVHDDWEQLGTMLAGRGSWRMAELLTGFRVPGEVMDYVRPLGAHCAPGVAIPDSVRRTGSRVRVLPGTAPAERAAACARDMAAPEGIAADRTTAVIVPEQGEWKDIVGAGVTGLESVSVLTADEAKGLEFDHVVVVEPSAVAADTPAGLRRLYVALTRCTQSLTVVHRRPLPRWIGGPTHPVPTPKQFMAQVTRRKSPGGGSGLCTRYRADGTRCDNETRAPDGWCRRPACGGFRTAKPTPLGKGAFLRVPKDAVEAEPLHLTPERVADIRISSAACGAFVARHRGSLGEAAVELHAMLIPFMADGRHLRLDGGGRLIDLHGYRFGLDAEARTVTSYDAVHAERSYAQFLAGVPTRVGTEARAARRSALSAPTGESGPGLPDEAAVRALHPETLHLTERACGGYERVTQTRDQPDDAFLRLLRQELAADLDGARVETSGSGIVVEGLRCQWWIRSDGRVLTTVRKRGAEIYRGHTGRQADHPTLEREPMSITSGVDETRPGEPETPETGTRTGLAETVTARVRTARRDRAHEALRHRLLAELYERSVDVGDSAHVDAWIVGSDGMTLFDVLGAGGHTYPQLREAALHLMEAAYLHPHGQAEHLVVVLREAPAEPWVTEVVGRAFSVGLAWWDGEGWAGPAARHITGDEPDEDSGA
ncbi:AAA family ATPase [Streptomyces avermitilis]